MYEFYQKNKCRSNQVLMKELDLIKKQDTLMIIIYIYLLNTIYFMFMIIKNILEYIY